MRGFLYRIIVLLIFSRRIIMIRIIVPAFLVISVMIFTLEAKTSYRNSMFKEPVRDRSITVIKPVQAYKDIINDRILAMGKTPCITKKITPSVKTRGTGLLQDEMVAQLWDAIGSEWENSYKDVYIMNQDDYPVQYIFQVWTSADTWFDTLKQTYTYNASNLPTEIGSVVWIASSSSYVDYDKMLYTYTQGLPTEYLKQLNFSVAGSTIPVSPGLHDSLKTTTTYNADSTVQQEVYQVIDSVAPYALVNDTRITYSYNTNQTFNAVLIESWVGGAWTPLFKVSFTYDANGRNTVELYQEYSTSAWVNYIQYLYEYDANDSLTKDLFQVWDGAAWLDYDQFLYEYDANGNLTKKVYQDYYMTGSWINLSQYLYQYNASNLLTIVVYQEWQTTAWVNVFQGTATYNASNQLSEEIYQEWSGTAWVNSERYQYTYGITVNTRYTAGSLFSGRVADVFHRMDALNNAAIHFTLSTLSPVSLTIFDLKGNRIHAQNSHGNMDAGSNVIRWNGKNQYGRPVAAGSYLYQLKVGDLAVTRCLQMVR